MALQLPGITSLPRTTFLMLVLVLVVPRPALASDPLKKYIIDVYRQLIGENPSGSILKDIIRRMHSEAQSEFNEYKNNIGKSNKQRNNPDIDPNMLDEHELKSLRGLIQEYIPSGDEDCGSGGRSKGRASGNYAHGRRQGRRGGFVRIDILDDFARLMDRVTNSPFMRRLRPPSIPSSPLPGKVDLPKNIFSPTKGGLIGIVAGAVLSERHVQEYVAGVIPQEVANALSMTDPLFYLEQTTGISIGVSWGLDKSSLCNPYGAELDMSWSMPHHPIWKAGSIIANREIEKEKRRLHYGVTAIPQGPKW